ncbi:MAG TPA: ECF-type sigma factor, partial [Candidatus Polarisedimenticolia bacterium]|nr:ECF-type sigma factor [Candidatus Polarisedimenticolia bacterium]
ARERSADSRGGGWRRVTLAEVGEPAADGGGPDSGVDVEALNAALDRLATRGRWGARQARIVELLYFCGCTQVDAARVLGLSVRTVANDWTMARAWLRRELR